MEQRKLRRFTLAVLASLFCPISAHALICPPGQKEVSGRCVAVHHHHNWNGSRPAADIVLPGSAPGSRPDTELAPAAGHAPPLPSGAASGGGAAANSATATKEASSNRKLVPVRAYLRSSEIPPPTVGAYGVVAFRARPTPASRSRLLMTCTAFVASIEAQKSLPSTVAVSDQMLTIWPLDDPSSPNAEKDDCDFAIDHYDLYPTDGLCDTPTRATGITKTADVSVPVNVGITNSK
jgi:hypothetical protein